MCWTDLIAGDSRGGYNREVAKRYGLVAAVYIDELINVLVQVKKKETYDPETGFFKLNRHYITDRTTVTADSQYQCDKAFTSDGFLETDQFDPDKLRLNMANFVAVMSNDKVGEIKTVSNTEEKPKKRRDPEAKKKGMIGTMCRFMETLVTDEDLKKAYTEWIAACIEQKTLTKVAVQHFIEDLNSFASDKNTQLDQIRYHASKAYNVFYKPHNNSVTRVVATSKPATAEDVDTLLNF